jgi:parvulin-like peptidyl-prolyl isomerase
MTSSRLPLFRRARAAGVTFGLTLGAALPVGCGEDARPAVVDPVVVGGEKIPSKHGSLGAVGGDGTTGAPGTPPPGVDPKDGIGPHGGHASQGRSAIAGLPKDAVVLKVDDVAFTRADLERTLYQAAALAGVKPEQVDVQMRDAFEAPAYEKLIERTLLVKEAKRRKLWPSDDEARRSTDEMLKTLPPGRTLQDVLQQLGIDEPTFREDVRRDAALAKLLKALQEEMPPPSDDAVRKIYDDNKAVFTIPDTASASHILVKVDRAAGKELVAQKKKEAEAILASVKGKDAATFARVAAEKSEDASGKARGGDLGAFRRGDLLPEFEELAFRLADGEVGGPVRTDRGWHVVRGAGTTKGRVVPLDEAKKVIAEREGVKAFMAKVDEMVASLRAAAKIERVVAPVASPLVDDKDPGSRVPSWRANAGNALRGMRNPHGAGGDVPLPASPSSSAPPSSP